MDTTDVQSVCTDAPTLVGSSGDRLSTNEPMSEVMQASSSSEDGMADVTVTEHDRASLITRSSTSTLLVRPAQQTLYSPVNGWTSDRELEEVKEYLRTVEKPSGLSDIDMKSLPKHATQFFLQGGGLYRRGWDGHHRRGLEKSDRESRLKGVHEAMGHRGIFATRRAPPDRFWWPGAHNDAVIWARGCPSDGFAGRRFRSTALQASVFVTEGVTMIHSVTRYFLRLACPQPTNP